MAYKENECYKRALCEPSWKFVVLHPHGWDSKQWWTFDMNLDAHSGHDSASENWEMPLNWWGAVQGSQYERAAVGKTPF